MKTFSVFFSLFCGIVVGVLSGCEKITPTMLPQASTSETQPLTVMTYNLYLGSRLDRVLSTENLLEVPIEVGKVYNNIVASDVPGRTAAIAASIQTYQPHVIGLQEVALIRRQSPGSPLTQRTPDAEEVVVDFLQLLIDALQADGLDYQVAASVENIDVEMPMFTETGIVDVRLTDSDVLLARGDVEVSRPMGANYTNTYTVERLALEIKRGYAAIDATVSGRTYRVVNTHLEAFSKAVRVAQMRELIEHLSNETFPILLLGDFNTPAPDGTAYQLLRTAGYVDLWQMQPEALGNTCCQDGDLLNDVSAHSIRIDHIFARNLKGPTQILTHTLSERAPSGVWASDHAGVVAQIVDETDAGARPSQ